jgi:type II secretory pathway pseudopilin PulG
LLTVIAIIAVLSTLLLSALAGAKTRANQAVCRNNLRQIAIAIEVYHDDAGRRPRTLSRLIARPTWLSTEKSLVCPNDPGLRRPPKNVKPSQWTLWGNMANVTQEPPKFFDQKNPEAGTWEAEIRETTETNRFSYLHPFTWQRAAFQRLGNSYQTGDAVCQLHGVRMAIRTSEQAAYTDYEGRTLRVQRDGAVVLRKIFRSANARDGLATFGETITAPLDRQDYPWEFYLDTRPPAEK